MIDNLNHLNNKQISQPSSYVCNEIDALEHEEEQIDREAASLEKRLRRVMENGIHFHQFQNQNFYFFSIHFKALNDLSIVYLQNIT
jgi:hypothetical protein